MGSLMPSFRKLASYGRTMIAFAMLAMLLDVVTQNLGWHASIHSVRIATGFAVGWSISFYLFATLHTENHAERLLRGNTSAEIIRR